MTNEERIAAAEERLSLAVHFAKAMIAELGQERALEIIGKGWEGYGKERLAGIVKDAPEGERFATFSAHLRESARGNPGLRIVEATPRRLAVEFTACPTYEVFRRHGIPEVCQKYCDSDYVAAKVIDQRLTLTRTRELAYGATSCDHCWTLED